MITIELRHPRFNRTFKVEHLAAFYELPIELPGGALYMLTFTPARTRWADEFVAFLTDFRCIMPPITPQADPMASRHLRCLSEQSSRPNCRLRQPWMQDEYTLRKREWAELRNRENVTSNS